MKLQGTGLMTDANRGCNQKVKCSSAKEVPTLSVCGHRPSQCAIHWFAIAMQWFAIATEAPFKKRPQTAFQGGSAARRQQ